MRFGRYGENRHGLVLCRGLYTNQPSRGHENGINDLDGTCFMASSESLFCRLNCNSFLVYLPLLSNVLIKTILHGNTAMTL